ncbi:TIGR03746 family integrating conjugative element protein [Salmonella enterica subsp. enterica]|uniref:Integrating conjugative element protein n=1 Tax=Citrobacter braakii TaxID=57706 RepID=A0A1V8NR69_CITBR|nr:TIGR03746 family integrating conjugative element protein [Citrobacter braakii]EBW7149024.1 TIGR03746 family integrating conjugative element protein [Salmonella enterica subsp. enterica serovar Coeln]EDV0068883.1 TIGR03746 family integrating conjugative element protein [Salmonella enterica subsp. enterica serovar Litchfield]EDV1958071.1 TIGR03746 family integrating conjugative element protein [Salmonella enterica subsp. enterica serovar Litchfield]OQM38903.1 integrating conjugative element pr
MSRFRNALSERDSHILTLRIACGVLGILAAFSMAGWMLAPRDLTVHVPPDLRSGSTQKWWEVPDPTVYSFGFYIFQQLNAWPKNGDADYPARIAQMSPYLTPGCQDFLNKDVKLRRAHDELRDRVRMVYEIPMQGYNSNSVRETSRDSWVVNLDLVADEYYHAVLVKRALTRYPLRVVKWEGDPERNPFGLALDCYAGTPQRLQVSGLSEMDNTGRRE